MGLGDIKSYDTTRVETIFRPLLDKIDFPNLNLSSVQLIPHVNFQQYLPLLKKKNKICHLFLIAGKTIRKAEAYTLFEILDSGAYTLTIAMSIDLFNGSSYDNPMIRNIIGIHEFLHCISFLFSIPELTDEKRLDFINECKTKMVFDFLLNNITDPDYQNAIRSGENLFYREKGYFYPNSTFFPDDHFRLFLDRAPVKYHNLNERFLLPRDKFESYFTPDEISAIKKLVKANNLTASHSIAQRNIKSIANEMHLKIDFVARRMTEILLSYS